MNQGSVSLDTGEVNSVEASSGDDDEGFKEGPSALLFVMRYPGMNVFCSVFTRHLVFYID